MVCGFSFVRWVLEAMGAGENPSMRHDFAPFGADVRRSELAGVKFRLKMCLLFVKADWA